MEIPNSSSVGILGCGWFGQALAKTLISKSYTVKGTTTQQKKLKKLEDIDVQPYQVKIYHDDIKGNLKSFLKLLDILIIAVPPNLKNETSPLKSGLKNLFKNNDLSTIKQLIYISSTGVFANGDNLIYDEQSKPNNESVRGKTLIDLEGIIKTQKCIQNTCILRLGGLTEHGGRHPIHYLSGKTDVSNPKAPINLIEKTDAVNLILKIIEHKNIVQSTFHGVYPEHEERETYYINKAKALDLEPPSFEKSSANQGKIIKSKITQKLLNFTYSKQP